MKEQSTVFERIRLEGIPTANPDSMVVTRHARFTILTSRLIRLEWTLHGQFENRSTFAFPNRYADAPTYSCQAHGSQYEIKTEYLHLYYSENGKPFSAANLSIRLLLNGAWVEWKPGTDNTGNLRGTCRTLDQCADAAALQEGLLSRAGWTLFDDSNTPVWDTEQTWIEARPEDHLQDWYFFGYGHDYKAALKEYVRFGGAIPLVPRFMLGGWWSRFWAYHANDLKQLVADFRSHDLPLDVLVLDMDWHTPDGWTGYTWNYDLFPDPVAFLAWAHEQGLHITLNLHPADGIHKHEAAYQEFARRIELDVSDNKPIQFNGASKAFIQNYFELLHHPLEDQGVDFWWIDWQQGTASAIRNLDPLTWLNHLHFRDATRRGIRPLLYSRWGGLGNHRYPIGFSGDTYATWESLRFQPYFTATAANVCYGWWSHDIGGHFGAVDPELYARWVQFGAVSPALRLHSTKDPLAERRPWGFTGEVLEAAKEAFQFRYQLLPYLYSAAWTSSREGISLCYPMYYEQPESEDAYLARDQYYFGGQLIAAPIIRPSDPQTGLAPIEVWIPDGTWYDYHTLEAFTGPRWIQQQGDLKRIPIYARAGAIVPLAPHLTNTREFDGSQIILNMFPGADGTFTLYEDDGTTDAYKQGKYELTVLKLAQADAGSSTLTIAASEGYCANLPAMRSFEIHFRALCRPDRIMVNEQIHSNWYYDEKMHQVIVALDKTSRKSVQQITLYGANAVAGSETSANAAPFVHVVEAVLFDDARQQLGTLVIAPPADNSPFDVRVQWQLAKDGSVDAAAPIVLTNCQSRQIFNCPFRDEADTRTFRWSAEVTIMWRGGTITQTHHSQIAYPSVAQWQALIYDPEQTPHSLGDVLTNGSLKWQHLGLAPAEAINLRQPFGLVLLKEDRQRIINGEPLEACLSTTLINHSPEPQEVILRVQHVGTTLCYGNGAALTPTNPVPHATFAPMFDSWMPPQQEYYSFTLQPGGNTLTIFTQPDRQINWWGVGVTAFDRAGNVLL
ncbi:MAG: DUF5110 domain-containing protein [Anaerolineae bacterium]|nr:DUF5110 domain-containing protein [Anaerolineae bacterium]